MSTLSKMKDVDNDILGCTLCKLSKNRTNAVPGYGRVEGVEVVLVGEAPGKTEDMEGKPFVGSGGKLLDELLQEASLNRAEVYVTNIVKCRPPNNRKPEQDEVSTCTRNYLDKQMELLHPLLIVTLGATALEYFTGKNKMGECHGKLMKTRSGLNLLPTYHPAAIFRTPSYRDLLKSDLMQVSRIVSELREKNSEQTKLTCY